MRRHNPPFNSEQYVLNKNTGEIHDLDNEKDDCQIDKIKSDHVYTCKSYTQALIAAAMLCSPSIKGNGCYYCLKEKDNG